MRGVGGGRERERSTGGGLERVRGKGVDTGELLVEATYKSAVRGAYIAPCTSRRVRDSAARNSESLSCANQFRSGRGEMGDRGFLNFDWGRGREGDWHRGALTRGPHIWTRCAVRVWG